MALLLLRHASSVPDSEGDGDEDASTFLTVSGSGATSKRRKYPWFIFKIFYD